MISFKKFIESVGAHGEYANDAAEKTMVHSIINLLMGGAKTDTNYEEAYSFIESDLFAKAYDEYYPAFQEKSMVGQQRAAGKDVTLSVASTKLINKFKEHVAQLYKQWKK